MLPMCEEVDFELTLRASKRGENAAKTKLAWYKLSGHGGAEIDVDGAFALLQERVKEGDGEAMWMLGICREYGLGCEQDIELCKLLYAQSSEAGNSIGSSLLQKSGRLTVEYLYEVISFAPWTELNLNSKAGESFSFLFFFFFFFFFFSIYLFFLETSVLHRNPPFIG